MGKHAYQPKEFGISDRPHIDIGIICRGLQVGVGVGHIISIWVKNLEKDELDHKSNKTGNQPDLIGSIFP
jgi:hypothetical protein